MMNVWFLLLVFVLSGGVLLIWLTIKKRTDQIRQKVSRSLGQDNYEFLVLDVRKKELFLKSHIPGAVHVSPSDIDSYYPSEDMFLNIYIYSQKGINARRGVRCLSRNGYFQVSSLGSYYMWRGKTASGEEINENE